MIIATAPKPWPWPWSRVARVQLALAFLVAVCAATYPDAVLLFAASFAAPLALAVLLKAFQRPAHSHRIVEVLEDSTESGTRDVAVEQSDDVNLVVPLEESALNELCEDQKLPPLLSMDSPVGVAGEILPEPHTLTADTLSKKKRSGKKSRSRGRNDSQSIHSNVSEDVSVSTEAPEASDDSAFVPSLTRTQLRRARRRVKTLTVDEQRMPLIPDETEELDREIGNPSLSSESSTFDEYGLAQSQEPGSSDSNGVDLATVFSPSGSGFAPSERTYLEQDPQSIHQGQEPHSADKAHSILASREALWKETQVLQSSNRALADYAQSVTAERDSLSSQYKALSVLHQEYEQIISSLNSRLENMTAEVDSKNFAELQSQKDALERDNTRLNQENDVLRAVAVSREEDWIRRMNDTEASYLRHMTDVEAKWAERVRSAEEEYSRRLHDLESQHLRELEAIEESKRQQVNEMERTVFETAWLHECVGAMSASYAAIATELEDSHGTARVLEASLEALTENLNACNSEIKQLSRAGKDLETMNASLASRITSKDTEIGDMKKTISDLKLQLDSSQESAKVEAAEVARLNDLVNRLHQENKTLQDATEELKRFKNDMTASAVIYKYEGVRSPTLSPILTGASLSGKLDNPSDNAEPRVTNRPSLNVLGIPLPVVDRSLSS
ncbi:hypothetical protein HDU83_009823 [Entophlyctis luteolus]|nr:hypothetical protein HDU83_009823 [Entophlyctis luteolus]